MYYKYETQLSINKDYRLHYGSTNEEGHGNTNYEDVKEEVEYDRRIGSLKEQESRDDCSLRQNLQNESNRSEGSVRKRRRTSGRYFPWG
jgi:hypothetical protein